MPERHTSAESKDSGSMPKPDSEAVTPAHLSDIFSSEFRDLRSSETVEPDPNAITFADESIDLDTYFKDYRNPEEQLKQDPKPAEEKHQHRYMPPEDLQSPKRQV